MPTISFFFGMIIQMYWRDHAPPHFHVRYNEFEGSVSIETGDLVEGDCRPPRRLAKEWAQRHRAELLINWERGRNRQTFFSVQGYDEDD